MGNKDGLIEGLLNRGRNKVHHVDDTCYLSFAFGNEIALVLVNQGYYILNCDYELWNQVRKYAEDVNNDRDKIIQYWIQKSEEYPISEWSNDFEDLQTKEA